MNDLAYKNYLYPGFGCGFGYLVENLIYLELCRAGFDVYVGVLRNKEVDFVAKKADRVIYIQSAYMLSDESTIEREYSALESIGDNFEKIGNYSGTLFLTNDKECRRVVDILS